MSTAAVSMPFSVLLRNPKRVTNELDHAGSVRLTRRDEDDLMLVKADNHEATSDGVSTTAQLLGALVAEQVPVETLTRAIARACPWTRFLPDHSLSEFIEEFVTTALACAELGQFQPLTVVLHAWRSTAAIHADPELARTLSEPLPGDDFGQVEVPQ